MEIGSDEDIWVEGGDKVRETIKGKTLADLA